MKCYREQHYRYPEFSGNVTCQDYQLYAYSLPITWNYLQDRPCKGETIMADHLECIFICILLLIGPWRMKKLSIIGWFSDRRNWRVGSGTPITEGFLFAM